VLEAFLTWVQAFVQIVIGNFARVLVYPWNPVQRLYWLYLASSVLLAALAWGAHRRRGGGEGFARFCFPREVWSHPSAWLDVRFFFVHQTLRVWIYGGLVVSISLATADFLGSALRSGGELSPASLTQRAVLTLVSIALVDLAGFATHVLQHRVPLLWEFHRVHHSLPVMHPLSNYREHPVDNFAYALVNGTALGAASAGAAAFMGCELGVVEVLGINVFHFAFNLLGYNLRHSHIWLAWPSWLGYVLGSPAYHQIHHSIDPRHIHRNFAFILPIWDRIFGSLYLPREPEPLRFGLGDGTEGEYDSVLKLYWLPFARIARGAHREPPGAGGG
jgi:sterol desaturase/sphingolipid hydroxylase (fatty acid hydroxylase superfamily)